MSATPSAIHVSGLSKTFRVPVREAGLKAAARSLVRRQWREIKAVDHISFEVAPGEMVGFLGPNGAGKTTTLKMLSGLLYPTSGEGSVLGYVPSRREKDFLRQITLVMGNRHQLSWDLPAIDSFDLNRSIYRIPEAEFKRTRDEFVELLDLKDLVHKPVRNLSLGERMKMEIVGALLHRPKVLFLDEPTIGLDVTMQRRLRGFVAEYNRRTGATVLLTSHYMADVVALCKRVIVIHQGHILYDGELSGLARQFAAHKTIGVTLIFRPTLNPTRGEVAGFAVALWGGFFVRFFLLWAMGLITFWTTRVSAIFELYFTAELLLSGRLVPLSLMPDWVQQLAGLLPFKWAFQYPIETLIGQLSTQEIVSGLGMQAFWTLIGLAAVGATWRAAVRRFSAVGN